MAGNDHPNALRLAESVRRHCGEAAANALAERHSLSKSASAEKKFRWAQGICEDLLAHFDPETVRQIRMDCACGPGLSKCKKLKALYDWCDRPDEFARKVMEMNQGYAVECDGQAFDLVYPECYCPCVRQVDGNLPEGVVRLYPRVYQADVRLYPHAGCACGTGAKYKDGRHGMPDSDFCAGGMKHMMKRVLFVCHGNICRSPMAEFVLRDMAERAGASKQLYVESAAVSSEEVGNPVHPGTVRVLRAMGISCAGKWARKLTRADYDRFDWLIGMDSGNIRGMLRILGGDPEGKVKRLLDFTERPADVDDPWYTGDFEATRRDVVEGCRALLRQLMGA